MTQPVPRSASPRPWLAGADIDLSLTALRGLYQSRRVTVVDVVRSVYRAVSELPADAAVFISLAPVLEIEREARRLDASGNSSLLPLFGVPFAVKDNIDVAGVPTTAACPEFAYHPAQSARVVEQLIEAGALYIGKTNLDQFATGLCGVRSPYGIPASAYQREYVAGGSSSGSAVAVAAGLVSFALGTDTGGSGRIPAGFNQIVGLKPSLGRLSTSGLLPNCRSLDCVSIFGRSVEDCEAVLQVAEGYDEADPFSRRLPAEVAPSKASVPPPGVARMGVPRAHDLEFFGDEDAAALFRAAIARLRAVGAQVREIDFTPYLEAGQLLFGGPYVAERLTAIGDFVQRHPEALHPTTRHILDSAARFSATDVFAAQQRQRFLQRRVQGDFSGPNAIDALLVPTAPRAYTIREMLADPIELNTRLGRYSYFVNLLDLCAVAVPNGCLPSGVPMGVTFIAPHDRDRFLLSLIRSLGFGAEAHPGAERRLQHPIDQDCAQ